MKMYLDKWIDGEPICTFKDMQKHVFWNTDTAKNSIKFPSELEKFRDRDLDPRPELTIMRHSFIDKCEDLRFGKGADYYVFTSEEEAIKWYQQQITMLEITMLEGPALVNTNHVIVLYHGYLSYNALNIVPSRVDEYREFIEVIDWEEIDVDDNGMSTVTKPGFGSVDRSTIENKG